MSRRVGSPNAAETAATAALKRPSSAPVGRSGSAVIGAVLTMGSLPGDQPFKLGRRGMSVRGADHPIRIPSETRKCMAADQSQLEAALSTVREPELGLTLGELGLVRTVRPRRRRVLLEVALPVAAWPGVDELAEDIHRAALSVAGVEEVELDFVVMTEAERDVLRQRLRAGMLGGGVPEVESDGDEHGHDHAGHGHGPGAA